MSLRSDREICRECGGTCCKCLNISFKTDPDPNFVEFLEVRGATKVKAEGGFVFLDNNRCSHFNDNGCDIQETKPQFCVDFPLNLPPEGKRVLSKICPLLKNRIKEK